jgi:SOS response regulatory protein OraA/RecX
VSYPHALVKYEVYAIKEVAMKLARKGLSAEQIREAMLDMAEDAADEAAQWAAEEDRRTA